MTIGELLWVIVYLIPAVITSLWVPIRIRNTKTDEVREATTLERVVLSIWWPYWMMKWLANWWTLK